MNNKINIFSKISLLLLGIVTTSLFVGCDDSLFRDDLPDANSKVDTVFPEANFDYTADQEDFRKIYFTDLSSEASKYSWDFGGGATSTEQDPTYTFEAGEGTYPVTFIASDGNDESSSVTLDVVVTNELISAFECEDFLCDPRTPWGGGRGTSTYSASGSPTPPEGNGGAKISSSSQFLDQTILVVADAEYEITFWYVSASSAGASAGRLLIEDADNASEPAFLDQDIPVTDQTSAYVSISYRVTTGAATENMRFNIEYAGTEARFSKISIDRIK
ncbi:PKD domain-containing protein [Zobellia amurskyensis]|uniref:PKD domain-containing protein n=1 Tax=Zobellia amurskyensis TaxID=248905 RepID=A0A7X2ZQW7_9FLAO|nr:PKD domain-containing protein [Zobellia amurskyensis]MUH34748.1 PKD domain-containing protein [Zobellia amurskyensis]